MTQKQTPENPNVTDPKVEATKMPKTQDQINREELGATLGGICYLSADLSKPFPPTGR